MTEPNPIIAFGLAATAAAMRAKCGQPALRHRIDLAVASLRLVSGDERACAAVADFLVSVEHDPVAAGHALQDFIDGWLDEVSPVAATVATEFDWQRRADLQ